MNTSPSTELLTFEERLQEWLKGVWEARIIWLGIGIPLLLVLVGLWGWEQWSSYSKDQRLAELGEVDDLYREKVLGYSEKKSELEERIADLKADTQQDALKSQLQRQLDELAEPDLSAVIEGYEELLHQYPHYAEGWAAGVKAARLKIIDQKLEEAADILARILEAKPHLMFYTHQVRWMYIGLLEDLGQYEKAFRELLELTQVPEFSSQDYAYAFAKPGILWAQVRLGLRVKDQAMVDQALQTLMNEHPRAPEMRWALLAQLAESKK